MPRRRILFIAATHGDENIGVAAMGNIEAAYDRQKYGYDWIVGNPRAYGLNVRYTESDLNRSAPGDFRARLYEERRAAEIVQLSRSYDFVIDLHGSVADCGIVGIVPKLTPSNLALAKRLPVERIVVWYSVASE